MYYFYLGMYLDRPHSVKLEFDPTPIVLDSSSSDQEKNEVTDTATVKKEVEASGGKKKERKIIWVSPEQLMIKTS